jgi:hypothetical protein
MSAAVTALQTRELKSRIEAAYPELTGRPIRHGFLYVASAGGRFNIPNEHGDEVPRFTVLKIISKMESALGVDRELIIAALFP